MKITLQQRIWADVRNHPGTTINDIMARIGHDHRSSVSSILSVLEQVEAISSKNGYSPYTPRKYTAIWETWKPDKMRAQYRKYVSERNSGKTAKHVPKVKNREVAKDVTPETTYAMPIDVSTPLTGTTGKPRNKIEEIFDSLSLNECRELHRRLDHLFGG